MIWIILKTKYYDIEQIEINITIRAVFIDKQCELWAGY